MKVLSFKQYGFKWQQFIVWLFNVVLLLLLLLWTLVMAGLVRKSVLPIYWQILESSENSSKISFLFCTMMCNAACECVCVWTCVYIFVYCWRMMDKDNAITIVLSYGTLILYPIWGSGSEINNGFQKSLRYIYSLWKKVFFQEKNPSRTLLQYHYLGPFHILLNSVLILILF